MGVGKQWGLGFWVSRFGAGKIYPAGYSGPDLYFWRYIDVASVTGKTVPGPSVSVRRSVDGFFQGTELPGPEGVPIT